MIFFLLVRSRITPTFSPKIDSFSPVSSENSRSAACSMDSHDLRDHFGIMSFPLLWVMRSISVFHFLVLVQMPPALASSQMSDDIHRLNELNRVFFFFITMGNCREKKYLQSFFLPQNNIPLYSHRLETISFLVKNICITFDFIYTPVTLVIGEGA